MCSPSVGVEMAICESSGGEEMMICKSSGGEETAICESSDLFVKGLQDEKGCVS